MVNKALEFNGKDSYVEIPYYEGLDITSNFSIQAAIKSYDLSSEYRNVIFSMRANLVANGINLEIGRNGRVYLTTDGTYFCESKKKCIQENVNYDITYVFNNNSHYIYVDGELVSQQRTTLTFRNNKNVRVIGKWSSAIFNGVIDEVRFWNKSLSQEEINEYLNVQLKGNEAGLVGLWNFNEIKNNIVPNLSNPQNTCTMYNCSVSNDTFLKNSLKFLIKQNNNYHTLKPEFYSNGYFKPLILNGGEQPNEVDYKNFGFDSLNALLTAQNIKIIQGIDKGNFENGKYFEVELDNEIKKINNLE